MDLPLHLRAAALVLALATTASIIVTLAEIGHAPIDGRGILETLLMPAASPSTALSIVTGETPRDTALAPMPEP